jgi:hypothetical protein
MRTAVLAMSCPNWVEIESFFKDEVGMNPVMGIESTTLDKGNPLAYPAVLNHKQSAMLNIDDVGFGFKAGFLSVGVSFDSKSAIIDVLIRKEFEVMPITSTGYIVTASYHDWHRRITSDLDGGTSEYHEFLSQVLLRMEMQGFRQMFSKYERKQVEKGIFKLW